MVSKGANINQSGHMKPHLPGALTEGVLGAAACPWPTKDKGSGLLESEVGDHRGYHFTSCEQHLFLLHNFPLRLHDRQSV